MKQLFRALVVAVLLAAVGPVGALGLGKLEKSSSLNERFSGRIPLVSVSADEISTLQVGLADESAFERADVVYAPVLRDLKFELVEPKTGQDYIQITSSKPIREPFLNFLVELNWASGRIFREYTVLLDPPLYDSQQQQASRSASAPARESSAASVSQEGHQVNYPDDTASRQRAASPSPAYSGGDYGPTRSGDTLWSIAEEMKPAGVTTHQMMLALLRANPDAFIGNNINGLKRGAVLQMPDEGQMNTVSQSEALAQVKNQHGLWDDARQAVAAEPAQRADSTTAAPAAEATTADTGEADGESGSRLELVGTEEGATGQTGDAEGSGQTAEKLAIANENLESLRQENAELEDRLAQNEALIEDLKRLIALKNDELASLQSRTAEGAADTESVPAGMVDMVEGVNYPSGDPSQFMNETTSDDELLPGPVPPEEPVSHTVNRPDGGDTPATSAGTTGDETVGGEAEGQAGGDEKAAAEPAQTAASEPAQPTQQPPAADGGMVDTLMGYVATARTFLLNNLMLVGVVLLAIIALLAGSTYMRRRQARIEEEADAAIASGTFPDFNTGDTADQTSFDNDAESATELNAATATTADDDATEIITDSAAEAADDDDDLFVVPQGEQGPQQSADEDDEDPLAEVNVLMAYEHFDQAESFVRNALKSDPNNVEYQAKLLEVFYAAGNKKKYEEAASDLRDMTGGKGEHWDMAVAMWQEMSPNRALFEGGGDEEDELTADSTGGGGIVDITGDTAGGSGAQQTSDTGGSLDFDLGDSTGGGSAATADDSSEMLDITASEEASGNDDMLDLTAAESSSGDDDMLDMTAATSQVDDDDTMLDMAAAGSLEAATSEKQSGSDDSEDDSFEFSLGDDDQNDNDLLDVTQSGSVESDEDLLDVTSSGRAGQSSTDEDDNSLDFSLDMDSESDDELDSEAMTAPGTTPVTADDDASSMDDLEAEFELDSGESGSTGDELAEGSDDSDNAFDFDLDIGDSDSAGDEQAASGSEKNKSDTDASLDMDLEIQDDADSNDLDEIGDELDRLEQTLGTLSRKENQDATKGFGSNTSDALDGIDSALEGMDSDSDTNTAAASSDTGDTDDGGIELSLDDDDNDDFSDFDLDTDNSQDSDDTSSVSLESSDDDDFSDFDLDIGDDDSANEGGEGKDTTVSDSLDGGDDDLTSDLSGFDFDLDTDDESGDPSSGSETGDNDLSAELSEISQELDSGDLDSATEDANDAGGLSMDFDLDTGEASGSGGDLEIELDESVAADGSSDDGSDETDFSSELDLDLSTDDMSANEDVNESIDMDSTVELPKDKLSGGLSLNDDEGESDGNDDEDSTLFVGRSSDTEVQSLEDELTTKLDLAKAYVELGDADSARGILEEVMKDGSDDQKRQAGEMLGQL